MELTVWGARGSYPASGADFSRFGHHTACLSVRNGDDLIVLDAGTGAAQLGAHLATDPPKRVHILLSHFHHDHVIGLPFLLFGLPKEAAVTIHSALGLDVPMKQHLAGLFAAPFFPADPAKLFAHLRLRTHAVGAGFRAGSLVVRTALLEHPGGCAAFRLDNGARSLVYATDLEASEKPPEALLALAQQADLLIQDTMFTHEEITERRGWGHSTIEAALALAKAAGVGRLAGFHHNPQHNDMFLAGREDMLAGRMAGAFLLREGQKLAV